MVLSANSFDVEPTNIQGDERVCGLPQHVWPYQGVADCRVDEVVDSESEKDRTARRQSRGYADAALHDMVSLEIRYRDNTDLERLC